MCDAHQFVFFAYLAIVVGLDQKNSSICALKTGNFDSIHRQDSRVSLSRRLYWEFLCGCEIGRDWRADPN